MLSSRLDMIIAPMNSAAVEKANKTFSIDDGNDHEAPPLMMNYWPLVPPGSWENQFSLEMSTGSIFTLHLIINHPRTCGQK